jgi:hypothetical protein
MNTPLMIATMPSTGVSNSRNLGGKKETVSTHTVVAVNTTGEIDTVLEARFYMSRSADGASPVYCSVWISGPECSTSGYGGASGYGYHKESAALQSALESAGITLSQPIDGRGSQAMFEAFLAIATACGYSGAMRVV